ncbi:nitroalkane oxidase [Streptomyces sp. 3212.3]|uniref:NAD(P)H-dependent flavin oxidoreductase n=1 Tax=unclassified Streptomyces TaxID=2593676 RepID=UPI00099EBDDC|nr:nitroalkane oxidase [Streptomyces sp. 3212.3]
MRAPQVKPHRQRAPRVLGPVRARRCEDKTAARRTDAAEHPGPSRGSPVHRGDGGLQESSPGGRTGPGRSPGSRRRYGVRRTGAPRGPSALPDGEPAEDDDHWRDKIDLLLADPVPVVSFTFGLPGRSIVAELRKAGTVVVQTVTSADEARRAAEIGVDAVIVQASAAGGHSATFTPAHPPGAVALPELITRVRGAVPLPVIAAGGLAGPADVADVLAAGAEAAMVGTALLRTDESGASAPHKAALTDPAFDTTVITRAFTGRPARALRNHFVERYDRVAPVGYPALHHLTGRLRRAATAAGDTRLIHLWAGTGHRHARTEPAARTFARLAGRL